jgi:hypothetical protein
MVLRVRWGLVEHTDEVESKIVWKSGNDVLMFEHEGRTLRCEVTGTTITPSSVPHWWVMLTTLSSTKRKR